MFDYLHRKKMAFMMASEPSIVTDGWYLPPGIELSQCIAAYQFIGRVNGTAVTNSQSSALKDLTGHGHTLTNYSGTWSSTDGYLLQSTAYLQNSSMKDESNIGTLIVRYKLASGNNDDFIQLTNVRKQNVGDSFYFFIPALRFKIEYTKNGSQQTFSSQNPGVVYQWYGADGSVNRSDYRDLIYAVADTAAPNSGVLGTSVWLNETTQKKGRSMYVNGAICTMNTTTVSNVTGISSSTMGNTNQKTLTGSQTGIYLLAAVFYDTNLSTAQHLWVAERLNAIKPAT